MRDVCAGKNRRFEDTAGVGKLYGIQIGATQKSIGIYAGHAGTACHALQMDCMSECIACNFGYGIRNRIVTVGSSGRIEV